MTGYAVYLFAAARELADTEVARIELPANATVDQLRVALSRQYPRLASLLKRCAIAVNHDFAEGTDPVQPGDELAVIPPVSGG